MLSLRTDIPAIMASRSLSSAQAGLQTAIRQLSSGLRIGSAADDPAGYFTSQTLTAEIQGSTQAIRNTMDGVSLAQTAIGVLTDIGNLLQRMHTLAIAAANGTVSDRSGLQAEFSQLRNEMSREWWNASFNGIHIFVLGPSSIPIQTGPDPGDTVVIQLARFSPHTFDYQILNEAFGWNVPLTPPDLKTQADAKLAIGPVETDIKSAASAAAYYGAVANRLHAIARSLQDKRLNLSAARSRIVDADFAKQTAALVRERILTRAATAMLTQAEHLPAMVLTLLRGAPRLAVGP